MITNERLISAEYIVNKQWLKQLPLYTHVLHKFCYEVVSARLLWVFYGICFSLR